eukprot:361455-Chlamydomonas_euryale.AAC.5
MVVAIPTERDRHDCPSWYPEAIMLIHPHQARARPANAARASDTCPLGARAVAPTVLSIDRAVSGVATQLRGDAWDCTVSRLSQALNGSPISARRFAIASAENCRLLAPGAIASAAHVRDPDREGQRGGVPEHALEAGAGQAARPLRPVGRPDLRRSGPPLAADGPGRPSVETWTRAQSSLHMHPRILVPGSILNGKVYTRMCVCAPQHCWRSRIFWTRPSVVASPALISCSCSRGRGNCSTIAPSWCNVTAWTGMDSGGAACTYPRGLCNGTAPGLTGMDSRGLRAHTLGGLGTSRPAANQVGKGP